MYGFVDINCVLYNLKKILHSLYWRYCISAWNCDKKTCLTRLFFILSREKLPVHVVVDPVLGKVLRPHQREVNPRFCFSQLY